MPSRWDIFAGYSYLAPKGTVTTTTLVTTPVEDSLIRAEQTSVTTSVPVTASYDAVNVADCERAYYFNRFVGVQGSGAFTSGASRVPTGATSHEGKR